MSDPSDVVAAAARSAEARRRLLDTAATLQHRLNPRTVARDTVDSVAATARTVLARGIDTVKRHPGKASGMLALTIAYLARRRIGAIMRGDAEDETPQPARKTRVRSGTARPAPKRNDR